MNNEQKRKLLCEELITLERVADDGVEVIKREIGKLILKARQLGVRFEVRTSFPKPLAMGNVGHSVQVTPVRTVYSRISEIKRQLEDMDLQEFDELLPPWATARNMHSTIKVGAQLLTKNSRAHGNGCLVAIKGGLDEDVVYHIITDIGSKIQMTQRELYSGFEIGEYIMNVDEYKRRAGWEDSNADSTQ